jgi:hypothetical protein
MTEAAAQDESIITWRQWLWEHAGRLAGIVLGMFAIAFLAILAEAGYTPAALFIPLVVAFLALIILGGRIRGE